MNVLITGAAGNLGTLTARYLRDSTDFNLVLMQHRKKIPVDLHNRKRITIVTANLSKQETIDPCLSDVVVIVHFAGVLFMANPVKFFYQTNVGYFNNLVNAAHIRRVKRVILISFPHVEGPTSRTQPARGILNGIPI